MVKRQLELTDLVNTQGLGSDFCNNLAWSLSNGLRKCGNISIVHRLLITTTTTTRTSLHPHMDKTSLSGLCATW